LGDGTISVNNLQLSCSGCPSNVNGLFFYGQGQQMGTLGNGFLCVQNNLHRLPVVQTGIFGDADYNFDVNAPPAVVTAGSTWNFQFWYRDVAGGGALYNASDALHVTFCP
jgi:hypothetical protein